MVQLRIMRNAPSLDNTIIIRGVEALSARLPKGWKLSVTSPRPRSARYRPDALLEIRAPDGGRGVLIVEARGQVTAQQAASLGVRLAAAAAAAKVGGALLVTRFVSDMTKNRLRQAGVSYLDQTGNAWITIERPALLIETRGAETDPEPSKRGIRSLKGAKAARLVRALCDWRPPVGVRQLARRAGTDPGYATRVLSLLEEEDVVRRDSSGKVTDVKWQDLLGRWARDYQVAKTNRAVPYLAPRGLEPFLTRLNSYDGRWALTGSFAVPAAASTARSRLVSCYLDDPERSAEQFDLRPADTGANVILLEPFDPVVWERRRDESGSTCVAVSQCAVDLLTGTGREPSEAGTLFAWMARNENAWRA
jgi:hypothetical protein